MHVISFEAIRFFLDRYKMAPAVFVTHVAAHTRGRGVKRHQQNRQEAPKLPASDYQQVSLCLETERVLGVNGFRTLSLYDTCSIILEYQ